MTQQKTKRVNRRSAFTLLEILVVVGLIAILATLGVVYLLPQAEKGKQDAARIEMKKIEAALDLYYKDHGFYPDRLDLLLENDGIGGPYIKERDSIQTPWSQAGNVQEYEYTLQDDDRTNMPTPVLSCVAKDGKTLSNITPQQ